MCIRTYHVVIDRVGHYLCRRKLFLHKMWHSLWALFIFPFQISYLVKPFPLTGCQKRSHNNELGKHLFNLNVYYYSMSYHLNQHDLKLNEHLFNLKVFYYLVGDCVPSFSYLSYCTFSCYGRVFCGSLENSFPWDHKYYERAREGIWSVNKCIQNLLWSFVDFSFYKFPPVYKENCKKLDTSEGNPMKTCLKLCSYNHPDNVDASIHGEKHKMLCE